jgi:hypothetical protein
MPAGSFVQDKLQNMHKFSENAEAGVNVLNYGLNKNNHPIGLVRRRYRL